MLDATSVVAVREPAAGESAVWLLLLLPWFKACKEVAVSVEDGAVCVCGGAARFEMEVMTGESTSSEYLTVSQNSRRISFENVPYARTCGNAVPADEPFADVETEFEREEGRVQLVDAHGAAPRDLFAQEARAARPIFE